MRLLATTTFLAILSFDLLGSVNPNLCYDGREPPHGVRRMIETLENNKRGAQQCAREGTSRSVVTDNRQGQDQAR